MALASCAKKIAVPNNISESSEELKELRLSFLSDSLKLYSILESYQETVYTGDSTAFRWSNTKKERELFFEILKRSGFDIKQRINFVDSISLLKLPTRFENPIPFFLAESIKEDVEKELENHYENIPQINIGTLPLWSLNARALNDNNNGESLVIVNTGLFTFCHEMAKILLETISIKEAGDYVIIDSSPSTLQQKIDSNQNLLVRFSKALEDYGNGRQIKGEPYNQSNAPLLTKMVNAMEFFSNCT